MRGGKSIRESTFPADLLLEANRKLAARLADSRQEHVASTPIASNNGSPETTPSRTWLPNWRRRFRPPVLAAALAALAILLVGAVTQRAALADIASSLLQRIVVTFNDEPLSDSQQQTFDELVEITETVDENGDQALTVNFGGATGTTVDQILQELGDEDGVLTMVIRNDSSTVSTVSVVNLLSSRAALDLLSTVSPDNITEEDGVLKVVLDSLSATDLLPAAKIGSQPPGVTEDQELGLHQESRRFQHGRLSLIKRIARLQAKPSKRTGPRSSSTGARLSSCFLYVDSADQAPKAIPADGISIADRQVHDPHLGVQD